MPNAGFPEGVDLKALSTQPVLEKGRRVLLDKCVACHDLKTVIARPRTPEDWVRTNKRMALKPSLGVTISEREGHQAAAYLIAITPNLQRSAKSKRADGLDRGESIRAAEEVLVALDAGVPEAPDAGAPEVAPEPPETPTGPTKAKPDKPEPKPAVGKPAVKKPVKTPFDMAKAKSLYEEECSLCHGLSDVTDAPPGSRKEVNQVLSRMIENGLDLEKEDLSLIRGYMVRRFVK